MGKSLTCNSKAKPCKDIDSEKIPAKNSMAVKSMNHKNKPHHQTGPRC